jgi:type I restriction enzyme S subunit
MNIDRAGRLVFHVTKYVPVNLGPEVHAGDVLFNNTNSRELVGKTTAIDGDVEYALSSHMTLLRPASGVSHRFMAYQLHYLWMSSYFRHRATQYVNQANISKSTLAKSVPFIVAPTMEQLRIVAEIEKQFSRLDAAEAGFATTKGKSREYLHSLLNDACNGRLVPTEADLARRERRTYESAEILRGRLTTSDRESVQRQNSLFGNVPEIDMVVGPSMLPEGWTWARMSEVGRSQLGRQRSPEHQTGEHIRPYLRVANVFEDRIDSSDVLQMNFTPTEFETYKLESGDILLNEGQSLELVGRAAIYREEVPGACFQNTLIRFRAVEGVIPSFALIVFRHYLHSKKFQSIARWSTNIAHLGFSRFVELEFPLPPTAEQSRIVTEFERLASVSAKQAVAVDALSDRCVSLRLSILHQAFSGKLVPQYASEGKATDLLRQISEDLARVTTTAPTKSSWNRGGRTRGASKMGKKRQSLYSILINTNTELSPEELFGQAGFDDESVEDFFNELKTEVNAGRIQEHKTREGVWLKAAK